MPKVTAQHVKDAGFRPEQFGTPGAGNGSIVDGDNFDEYLAPVLADAETWASGIVGASAYAAATGAQLLRLRNAELCYVKAALWRRRMAFVDSNTQSGLDGNASEYLNRREFEAHAKDADACASNWMQQVIDDNPRLQESGLRAGHVESGPYRSPRSVPGLGCC